MDSINIPSRFFFPNTLDYYKPEDYDSDGALRNSVIVVDGKLIRSTSPNWRLVQVYSIQFLHLNRKELRQICGSIELDINGRCFSRQPGQSCHDIDEKGIVRLSGPECSVWAEDYVEIISEVYNEKQPGDLLHPLNKATYLASPLAFHADTCDEVVTRDIPTPCGTMRVAYAILSNAADCYVTIKLLQWEGSPASAANIYGTIIATDSLVTDERAKNFVFHRKKDEGISVHEGQYIPLQRPCIAVSMGHDLVLDICICHKNDSPLLNGKLKFRPKCGNADDLNTPPSEESDDNDCSPSSSKKSDQTGSQGSDSTNGSDQTGSQGSDSSKDSDNSIRGGIYEAKQLSGISCKIQVKVFWLPCWSEPEPV